MEKRGMCSYGRPPHGRSRANLLIAARADLTYVAVRTDWRGGVAPQRGCARPLLCRRSAGHRWAVHGSRAGGSHLRTALSFRRPR